MKKLFMLLILTIIFIVAGIYFWWQNGLQPVKTSDRTQQIFIVQKGEGTKQIAANLKAKNLIRDATVFYLMVKQMKLEGKIQAGDFRLSPSLSTEQIAKKLTMGTHDIWVTIPEGKRAEEIADILQDKLLNFDQTWRQALDAEEGYLFPDTYLFPRDVDLTQIISMMKHNFEKKYADVNSTSNTTLTSKQIVIVASMIEREARFAEDRRLIASVIYNRLKVPMRLQIDATVQYAIGYDSHEKTWWKQNLSNDDLIINSPYNTYKNDGLPPAPICNPGLDSLNAALNPTNTTYLFYITDKSGHTHYARSETEHDANIKKYGI